MTAPLTHTANTAGWLTVGARRQPEQIAIIADKTGQRLTYRELDLQTDALARGLRSHGICDGARVLVLVRAGIDLVGLTYALFKAGAVPVLIDPGMGRRAFLGCVEQLAPTAFVGIPLGHVIRLLFPSSFRSVKTVVTAGTRLFWGGPTLDRLAQTPGEPQMARVGDDDEAAVLFTSGSTGPAKGVVYTHGMFNAQVRELGAIYDFQPGEIDLAAFPLFSLFDLAFGMTSVIPDLDPSKPGRCDPAKVAGALTRHKCTTAFGSPAIWRRVAPWASANGVAFPELRRVLIAGAAVPPTLIAELGKALPNGDVGTPYGATESLPVCNHWGHDILGTTAALSAAGRGTCVGTPAPGITIRILAVTDDAIPDWSQARVLPTGEIGEITVFGDVVTREYANRPEATRAAKIPELVDGKTLVWHRVGDLGYLDESGRLWFCGRKSERLETAAGPLYTDCVEGRLAARCEGRRIALVGLGPRGVERPAIVVEGARSPSIEASLRGEGFDVFFRAELPVDVRHNAKIHRLQLKAWAETQTGISTR